MTAASVDTVVQVKARTSTCCRHRRKPGFQHICLCGDRRPPCRGMGMPHSGSPLKTSDEQNLYSAREQALQGVRSGMQRHGHAALQQSAAPPVEHGQDQHD